MTLTGTSADATGGAVVTDPRPVAPDSPRIAAPVTPSADTDKDSAAAPEKAQPRTDPISGEALGPLVHLTRLDHDRKQAAKEGRQRFRLGEWDERPEHQQALDILIAGTIAEVVKAAVRGRFGHALREHYLAGIMRVGTPEQCNPMCVCPAVLGLYPSTRRAVDAWIGHVMEVASEETPDVG